MIVPLFALANAGIHIDADLLGDAVTRPITLGIVFGYVVGKPIGITAAVLARDAALGHRAAPGAQLAGGRSAAGPSAASASRSRC